MNYIDIYKKNNKVSFDSFIYLKNIDFFLLKIFKSPWKENNKNFLNKNKLILEVSLFSNKIDIKNSLEILFNIKIIKINTLIKKNNYKNKKCINKKKAFIKFIRF